MVASSLGSTTTWLGVAGGLMVLCGAAVLVGARHRRRPQANVGSLSDRAMSVVRWLLGR